MRPAFDLADSTTDTALPNSSTRTELGEFGIFEPWLEPFEDVLDILRDFKLLATTRLRVYFEHTHRECRMADLLTKHASGKIGHIGCCFNDLE